MSKAFTSEETPDDEIVVPPRAPLPPGVPNWVTPRGLELLRSELTALESERRRLQGGLPDEDDRSRRLATLTQRIAALAERLSSARLARATDTMDRIHFGSTVTLTTGSGPRAGEQRRFRIVGVDEANPAEGRVAFTAPIARAILGSSVGDEVTLSLPRGEESLAIVAVDDETH